MKKFQSFIGGKWCDASTSEVFKSIDSRTGEEWASIPVCTASDVDDAVQAAHDALTGEWGKMSASNRAALLLKLADEIDKYSEDFAEADVRDNGKVFREMHGQALSLSEWYRYYAGWADKLCGDSIYANKPDFHIYTKPEPVGVVGAITAWNSPLLLLAYKLAPALAAGCSFVVKPSELASTSTLLFAKCFQNVGFPDGVFSVVTGSAETGKELVKHPLISKVTFTGSSEIGKHIAHAASSNFKRLSLELGGKSANIVFADADLNKAANGVIAGIFAAGGQTCMAGSRLLVHDSIADELIDRVRKRALTIKLGDPMDPETEMGPLISSGAVDRVLSFIDNAEKEGAKVIAGGTRVEGLADSYLAPTILDDVMSDMEIYKTELFAPVLVVQRVADDDEAISLANNTEYGLVAGIWTENINRAHLVSAKLNAGTVWVNAYRVVSYAVPTSGRMESGYGYENGRQAINEFISYKSVWINLSDNTRDPFTIG